MNTRRAGSTENPRPREKLQYYRCTIRQQPSTTPASKKQSSTTSRFSSNYWRATMPSTLQRMQSQVERSRLLKNGCRIKRQVSEFPPDKLLIGTKRN